ncbi:hypothetical protein [Paenibacillus sp. FJAT-26967]|uniref:hypothetical protein n=1 Tax=Paenibacillus sp. FJAT-26967 TaxID=1729690 RepID=UPI0008399383|nr:hypothetical protein [Paenibacillus sp. FJAT-26967]
MKPIRMFKNTLSPLRNETGSTSILTVFTLGAVIIGSVCMFYYFTVFIEKRQAQNIADTGAIAAVQTLRDEFQKKMEDASEESMSNLLEKIDKYIESFPEEDRPTFEEAVENFLGSGELTEIVKSHAFKAKDHWLLVVKHTHFASDYTAEKNGDKLMDAYLQNSELIKYAAVTAIEQNKGNSLVGEIEFPFENESGEPPKLLLKAARTLKIDGLSFEKDLDAAAAANVSSKDFDITVRAAPARISW